MRGLDRLEFRSVHSRQRNADDTRLAVGRVVAGQCPVLHKSTQAIAGGRADSRRADGRQGQFSTVVTCRLDPQETEALGPVEPGDLERGVGGGLELPAGELREAEDIPPEVFDISATGVRDGNRNNVTKKVMEFMINEKIWKI